MVWWLWKCWWSRTCFFLYNISPRGMTIVLHNDHFPRNDHFTCNDHFPRNNYVGRKWPNNYSVGLRVEESGFGIFEAGSLCYALWKYDMWADREAWRNAWKVICIEVTILLCASCCSTGKCRWYCDLWQWWRRDDYDSGALKKKTTVTLILTLWQRLVCKLFLNEFSFSCGNGQCINKWLLFIADGRSLLNS